jgi:hypothetical protein
MDDRKVITFQIVGAFLGIDTGGGIHRFGRGHHAKWPPVPTGVHRTTFCRQSADPWP